MSLNVKLLLENAKAPTVAHPGEDLGFDLYAAEAVTLFPNNVYKVRTGIAVEDTEGYGFLIKDRSSMAVKGIFTHGGVIDAGYRGELSVMLTTNTRRRIKIKEGSKIAQMVPVKPVTSEVLVVPVLSDSSRGEKGFGSSGQ